MLSTVLGVLPLFLLGGLAVLVRDDLGFGETQLGLAVSLFFTMSAATAVVAGHAVRRMGSRTTTRAAAALSSAALLSMSLAPSYGYLLAGIGLAGLGNSLAQLGTNASLARDVQQGRQGFAFGIKQGSVPAATLLAGLMLPLLGLTLGWRLAFAGASLLAVACVLVAPRPRAVLVVTERPECAVTVPLRMLLVVAVSAGLAAAGCSALGVFLVESAVEAGLEPSHAGLLLAGCSVVGVGARIYLGWRLDVRPGVAPWRLVTAIFTVGGIGMLLLATSSVLALALGAVLAFGLGWSWPGLLLYALVQLDPDTPAGATSLHQTGVFVGGAVGPLAFGSVVQAWSYLVAWSVAAAAMFSAAVLLEVARRRIVSSPARARQSVTSL